MFSQRISVFIEWGLRYGQLSRQSVIGPESFGTRVAAGPRVLEIDRNTGFPQSSAGVRCMFQNLISRLTLVLLMAPAAVMAGVVGVELVKLDGGPADFGSGLHAFGAPTGNGSATWTYEGGVGGLRATVRVKGTLYLDSTEPSCAQLILQFQDQNRATIQTRTREVCNSSRGNNANDSSNKLSIDESFTSNNLNHVVLRTRQRIENTYVNGTTKRISAPATQSVSVKLNNGNTDFGTGLHAGGGPTGDGLVRFTRDDGNVTVRVNGTLYWDNLFAGGCAQIKIEVSSVFDHRLHSRGVKTLKKCGVGGNANDAGNKLSVDEGFTGAALMWVTLQVGTVLADGSFSSVVRRNISW